jgi:hypothetical protein
MCYAVTLAYDDASDPVYSDGWQEGDDGGGGADLLGPWNFDGITYNSTSYGATTVMKIDDGLKSGASGSSPHNDIGRSWAIFNPNAGEAGLPFMPDGTTAGPTNPPNFGTNIAQPGRAILGGLQVGQTLKVVVDNPAERRYYRGFAIKFNTGGAAGCWNGDNCSTTLYDPGAVTPRFTVGTFEYYTYGQWSMTDVDAPGVPLYDQDGSGGTAGQVGTSSGLRIEFTLTGADTFEAKMIPLDSPGNTFTKTGVLDGTGVIDWLEFEFYNTDSDYYPTLAPDPTTLGRRATDFYVRSIEILAPDPPGVDADYNDNGTVDAADYVVYRKLNGTGFDLLNEVSGASPGEVTPADYDEWMERFGEGSTGGSSPVPEPGEFVFVVAGIAGLISLGWRDGR